MLFGGFGTKNLPKSIPLGPGRCSFFLVPHAFFSRVSFPIFLLLGGGFAMVDVCCFLHNLSFIGFYWGDLRGCYL